MEEHLVSPADAWTHLLASLKLLPGFDDIQVTITDETIHILCRDPVQREAIKKHLEENLAIPERLIQNTRTQLNIANEKNEPSAANISSTYRVQYPEEIPAPPKSGEGITVVKNLFGEEYSSNAAIRATVKWADFFEEHANTAGVLFSKDPVSGWCEPLCAEWAKKVTQEAARIPLYNLRRMYAGQPLVAVENDEDGKVHRVEEVLFERCFGFVQKGEHKYFYCDPRLLYEILFAPKIVEQPETEKESAALIIDKNHFIAYLRQIYTDGLLMALVDSKKDTAVPVLLPSPNSKAAPTVVVLMLDVSGSMARSDGEYEKNVLALVEELAKRCTGEHDQLIIVPFANQKVLDIRTYAFAERAKISEKSDWLNCDGNTRLYGSLAEVLSSKVVQGVDHRTHNLNLILVTDGCDNVGTAENKKSLDGVIKSSKIVVPQFFTMGYGKKYDAKLCEELTTITGGRHQALENIAELAIMKHLEEVVRPRTLVEFKEAVDALQAIFISVYSEPVALTDFVICEGQEFVLNGRKISFSTRDVVVEEIKVNAQFPEPERRPEDAVRAERHAVVMRALGQFQLRPEERMRLLYMEKPGAPAGLPEHRKFSTFGANMTGGKQ